MKIIANILLVCITLASTAQTTITGRIKNGVSGAKVIINIPFDNWIYADNNVDTLQGADGSFNISVPLRSSQFIIFDYGAAHIKLYAEPLKDIQLSFDALDYKSSLSFSGSLANENALGKQTGLTYFELVPKTWNGSLTNPLDIFEKMQAAQKNALAILRAGKTKTTTEFKKIAEAEIQYFPIAKLMELSFNNNAWTTDAAGPRHFALSAWKAAINKAYDAVPLSDSNAVNSYNYMAAVNNLPFFVQRKFDSKQELVPLAEKIMGEPFDQIMADLRKMGKSYWSFKVFNYYLTGAPLQKALAAFIYRKVHLGELEYIDEAYNDFITRFPRSKYMPVVKQVITPYLLAKAKAGGADKTTFITDTAITFNQLVSSLKGSVIYVDIWGTWCPACRDEMLFSPALAEKFNDKRVAFMYIAFEHNTNPEKYWQQTVHFFKLNGLHVLANNTIKKYIEDVYKNNGMMYPSYILIDKNGNIANINAGRPSSGEELYKQIEALL